MSTLADQLKAALALPHMVGAANDYSEGRTFERNRTKAIDQALCEVVEFLERNAPRFYGETEVALETLFERLRAALEPAVAASGSDLSGRAASCGEGRG